MKKAKRILLAGARILLAVIRFFVKLPFFIRIILVDVFISIGFVIALTVNPSRSSSFYWMWWSALVLVPIFLIFARRAIKEEERRASEIARRDADPVGYYRDRTESWIELRLYNALVKRGYRVVTQHPCGPYWIDLALPDYGLAIECDGKAYHSSPEQKRYDRRRDAYLRRRGWKVMRFTGSQINGQLPKVVAAIEKKIGVRS